MNLIKLFNPFLVVGIIKKNRYLLTQLVRRNIESRYKGSSLGLLWSFVQPLMMLCVYMFVFSFVLKARWGIETGGGRGSFAIIMFCGMAIFNIFSESVVSSCSIITTNQNYVKKVIFPLEILPIAQVLSTVILSAVWFILLFAGKLLFIDTTSWTMLLLPCTIIPLIMFTTGICFFMASLGVYIRDVQHLIGVVIQMLFFMTPIFYPLQAVPEKFRWILNLNPLALIVEETRKIFLYGQQPNWLIIAISFVVGAIIFQFGLAWFIQTKKGFADVL